MRERLESGRTRRLHCKPTVERIGHEGARRTACPEPAGTHASRVLLPARAMKGATRSRRRPAKPPLPAHKGLFGRPTVINNLLTLACVPAIRCSVSTADTRSTLP